MNSRTAVILGIAALLPLRTSAQSPAPPAPTVRYASQSVQGEPVPPPVPIAPQPPTASGDKSAAPFTLAQLESIALANNPTMGQAAARVEAARGRWVQVGLPPNPTAGYQADEIGNEHSAGKQGAFISQEFLLGHKLALNRQIADREIAQAQRQFDAQRYRVLSDVRIQFYEVLAAQRAQELSQEIVGVGGRAVEAARRLYELKETSKADLLQAQIEVDRAEIAVTNAQNHYTAAWRKLAAVLGTPDMAPVPLAGNLLDGIRNVSWEEALVRLMQSSPELAAAQMNVARAKAVLERAQAEPIPNATVMSAAQHDNVTGFNIANVQVGLSVPLFNRNQGAIRQAEADLRGAQAGAARVELDLRHRLATAFERYANARHQVDKYTNRILPNSKESLEIVQSTFRAGEGKFLAILIAQRTYAETNLAYVDALRELWESSISIENLLLQDSLQFGSDSGAPASGPSER